MVFPQLRASELLRGKLPINILTDCTREQHTMHMHNYADLYYIISGSLLFTIDDKELMLTPGTCVFIPPFTPHTSSSLCSDDTPIIISASFFDSFLTEYGYDYFSYIRTMASLEGKRIETYKKFEGEEQELATALVKEMSQEFQRKKNMSLEKLSELLSSFLRLLREAPQGEEVSISDSLRERVNAITTSVRYIADNFDKKLTIDSLAAQAAMSRAAYIRNFEMICGIPVARFIFLLRVNKAGGMLLFTEMSLNEIAVRVGLNSKARLCTAFRDVFGMTTTEYKNKNRPKEFKSKHYIDNYWSWLDDHDR